MVSYSFVCNNEKYMICLILLSGKNRIVFIVGILMIVIILCVIFIGVVLLLDMICFVYLLMIV